MVENKKIAITLFLTLLFASTLLLLLLHKGVVLQLRAHTETGESLHPQIYYKKDFSDPYTEKDSVKAEPNGANSYYFPLKNYQKIAYLRLDPNDREGEIVIESLTLIKKGWFHTHYYRLNLEDFKPLHQIEQIEMGASGLRFKATGKDPFLEMPLKLSTSIVVQNTHLDIFVIALIIALVGSYLFYLYQTREPSERLYAKLTLYALFFAFTIFKVVYYKEHIRFGYPPDELAHLSYIDYVHKHHHFIPDYNEMKMINNPNSSNYLSHPPLYYEIMNLVYDTSKSIRENVANFRNLSSLIFLLAFVLILYIGLRANLSIVGDLVFLSLFTAIPMHSYIGASISNDNLAMLGVALFALGFLKLLEREFHFRNYLLVAIGGLVAYFSKLTAALLIFFALLYYLFYLLYKREMLPFRKKEWLLFLFILIPIFYYQISIMLQYHAIVPTFNKTHPIEYLHSPFYVEPKYRQHLNIQEWFDRLLGFIEGGWFGIHSHHSFTKESWWGSFGLLVLHIFAIIALFLKCPKEKSNFCLLGKIVLLALLSTLVVQFFFSYRAHLNSGYMGGLQPRYLLPFMFGFAIMASLFVERLKSNFWGVVLVILLSIHALYSDFFYFLQYYR